MFNFMGVPDSCFWQRVFYVVTQLRCDMQNSSDLLEIIAMSIVRSRTVTYMTSNISILFRTIQLNQTDIQVFQNTSKIQATLLLKLHFLLCYRETPQCFHS